MQIISPNNLYIYPNQSSMQSKIATPLFSDGLKQDTINFKSSFNKKEDTPQNKINSTKLETQRLLNKLFNKKLCDTNFEQLEGAQEGLKTFEDLSMKQIAFALTDLHSINMISGCTRHCLHCYANAQPFVKKGTYEDFKQICDDIKELENRTGAKACHHHGEKYTNISFDADALDCHLFDKDGNKHDFVDIAKLMYKSTGYKPVFDTNGWDTKEKQQIAEDYVQKLITDDNYKYFHQINVSINPFSPKYVKAIKSGYDPNELYMPFKKISLVSSKPDPDDNLPEDFKKARNLYTGYVKNVANTLVTMKPLLKCDNFGLIVRTLNDNVSGMEGFKTEDFAKTLNHINNELAICRMVGEITAQEHEQLIRKLGSVSNRIFTSGRMEKFYKVQNGSLDGIESIDTEREAAEKRLNKIKNTEKLSSAKLRYLKMIDNNGKVYLYDNYKIIPTDIQLKIRNSNSQKPFQIKVEDYTITEDMIDFI